MLGGGRRERPGRGPRSPAPELAKKRAIVAIARTLIVIIWHLLITGRGYRTRGGFSRHAGPIPKKKPSGSLPGSKPSATRSPLHLPPKPSPGSANPCLRYRNGLY